MTSFTVGKYFLFETVLKNSILKVDVGFHNRFRFVNKKRRANFGECLPLMSIALQIINTPFPLYSYTHAYTKENINSIEQEAQLNYGLI